MPEVPCVRGRSVSGVRFRTLGGAMGTPSDIGVSLAWYQDVSAGFGLVFHSSPPAQTRS